ncbi:MAG: C4-type zinc ribbon domain-containing protein [Ilumatobacter sp.]|uniref:zinc ribbon domain-containing protein n=1 Tax=Ilumatobacter sp. TaxID=1967498 RepID=UPI002606FC4C|nr:C4-type zinc ribbon domain-containing protein [Ilumatobacter sp.]MDJ0767887.1 C4-type zinc ribbon domain-containing protein [Ilumatobacter sp.]
MTHPMLELQAADTMADQLRHRREHLGEREQMQAARNALVRWDQSRKVMRQRLDELSGVIEECESKSHDLDAQRDRLQAQLKTVIAPREAEALQSEIATVNETRSGIDDEELAALEEQARIDDELTEVLGQEEALREAFIAADEVLSAAEADIDGELERIAERLEGLRAEVDKASLRRYDRLREQHVVAAATLAGSRCEGCHLDLSAAEVDVVKDEAASSGGLADCPQCGRILVI